MGKDMEFGPRYCKECGAMSTTNVCPTDRNHDMNKESDMEFIRRVQAEHTNSLGQRSKWDVDLFEALERLGAHAKVSSKGLTSGTE